MSYNHLTYRITSTQRNAFMTLNRPVFASHVSLAGFSEKLKETHLALRRFLFLTDFFRGIDEIFSFVKLLLKWQFMSFGSA